MENKKETQYPKCAHIPITKFINEADEEIAQSLGKSYELLPLFESGMFERVFKKHYSVTRNPSLSCRWREYKQGIETRVFAPVQLPDIKELHFYNGAIRYHPAASVRNKDNRRKLKPGPGVDHVGQMPIPQEALMKRSSSVKTDKRVKMAGKGKEGKEKKNIEGRTIENHKMKK